jgi:hypothetical protein
MDAKNILKCEICGDEIVGYTHASIDDKIEQYCHDCEFETIHIVIHVMEEK